MKRIYLISVMLLIVATAGSCKQKEPCIVIPPQIEWKTETIGQILVDMGYQGTELTIEYFAWVIDDLVSEVKLLRDSIKMLKGIIEQQESKKYREADAKNEFTIGMSKARVWEIIGENRQYYSKSVSTVSGVIIEVWEFDNDKANAALALAGEWAAIAYIGAQSIKAKCPTLIFKEGRLTDIIR